LLCIIINNNIKTLLLLYSSLLKTGFSDGHGVYQQPYNKYLQTYISTIIVRKSVELASCDN